MAIYGQGIEDERDIRCHQLASVLNGSDRDSLVRDVLLYAERPCIFDPR